MGLYEQVDYDFSGPLQPQDLFGREYVTMGGVIDHHLTTTVQSHIKMLKKPVVITDNRLFLVLAANVQKQQNSRSYVRLRRPVVVLRRQVPGVRIPSGAPKACDIKNVTGFFLCCIAQNQQRRWPIFQMRFIEMSNHFKSVGLFCWAAWCAFSRPCRPVLQFFSGIFNFFLLFSECFQFPRSQFPIGCGFFSFFAVAGKMGTARTFISFPIMRMCGGFSNRTSSMQRLQISDTRAAVSYNTHNP